MALILIYYFVFIGFAIVMSLGLFSIFYWFICKLAEFIREITQ